MKRKEFIKSCGYACFGMTSVGMLLQSCVSTKSLSAPISNGNLVISKSDFVKKDGFLEYAIVSNEQLQFPIYVYRFSDNEYTALYLKCTHQGNQVSAYGDKLVCSGHGSVFDNKGKVTKGPATQALRYFPIQVEKQNILISLKSA